MAISSKIAFLFCLLPSAFCLTSVTSVTAVTEPVAELPSSFLITDKTHVNGKSDTASKCNYSSI